MLQHLKGIGHLLCLPLDQSKNYTSIGMILEQVQDLLFVKETNSSVQIKLVKARPQLTPLNIIENQI